MWGLELSRDGGLGGEDRGLPQPGSRALSGALLRGCEISTFQELCLFWLSACHCLLRPDAEAVRVLAANIAPPDLKGGYIDRDDEEFAKFARRALERADAVPGMRSSLE